MKKKARGLPLVQDLAQRLPNSPAYKHPRRMQHAPEPGQLLPRRRKQREERLVRPPVRTLMSPQMKILLELTTLSHFQCSSV